LIDESRPKWHCLRTRSRQDRILARELAGDGLEVFAPVSGKEVQYGGTWVHVDAPVFPDLVFVYTTADIVTALAASERVREVVVLSGRGDPSRRELTVSRARELLGIAGPRRPVSRTGMQFEVPSSGSWAAAL
jgi:hypothetical protein